MIFRSLAICLLLPALAGAAELKSVVFPLNETTISSEFGARISPTKNEAAIHSGLDLPAPQGTDVRALSDGVVSFSGNYGGYGNLVVVRHGSGITSHYGHLESIRVKVGERITAGQAIATVGQTGRTTGPHLHFEIRINGVPQDPSNYMPGFWEEARG